MAEQMRIQRALARSGVASRRGAEELVAAGRVRVNGDVATVGQVVDPEQDSICVDGRKIGVIPVPTWIVLNKPQGVVTTRRDPAGRETVFDVVHDRPGLTYVGRLDYLTEGVLLLTTDGTAAHALTHPSRQVERTYVAVVRGDAVAAARWALRGVELEDGIAFAASANAYPLSGRRHYELELTLTEGRRHEVRRLCAAMDLEVERLVRTAFGPVQLGDLPTGATRALTKREFEIIAAIVKQPPTQPPTQRQKQNGRYGTRKRGNQ